MVLDHSYTWSHLPLFMEYNFDGRPMVHVKGDTYLDITTRRVYQWNGKQWVLVLDPHIIQAAPGPASPSP